MAGDIFKFVDSVSSSATVRLDINDQSTWAVKGWDAPPAQLRRILNNNTLTDGGSVSASQYELRTLSITLELVTTDQDTNATQIQLLARELDRTFNFLRYQPVGATKPVYFKTYRSDIGTLVDAVGAKAFRTITINLLADPFAIGEREETSLKTVYSDPASATNPIAVTTGTVLGDVPVRPVITWYAATSQHTAYTLLVATEPASRTFTVYQPESTANTGLLGADTTVAAANDATYSGSGANYVTVSFATQATMAMRYQFTPAVQVGRYRVLVRCKKSVSGDTVNLQGQYVGRTLTITNDAVAVPSNTFQIVDLGIFALPTASVTTATMSTVNYSAETWQFKVMAQRASGTGSLTIDYVLVIPADYSLSYITGSSPDNLGYWPVVIDGEQNMVYSLHGSSGSIFDFVSTTAAVDYEHTLAGGFPVLAPGATWRVYLVNVTSGTPVTNTDQFIVSYFPRYLHVRPPTS